MSALKAGAKPKSVKNHLVTLKTMFNAAVKWGYLAFNPAASVKAPKVEREEMDILKPAEIRTLLGTNKEGVAHIKPGWHVPIKFAIFTGLRQGEQLALRVGDLDFYNGQVCATDAHVARKGATGRRPAVSVWDAQECHEHPQGGPSARPVRGPSPLRRRPPRQYGLISAGCRPPAPVLQVTPS